MRAFVGDLAGGIACVTVFIALAVLVSVALG